MSLDQIAIISIICAILLLFVFGQIRYDLVSVLGLIAATIFGVVNPADTFTGFGHPATITVALVLVLSSALTKSGAIESITKIIEPTAKHEFTHIASLTAIAAVLSMFMNNVGALALLMPVAIQTSYKAKRHPAVVLMPLSFGSILGGLVTLIGTPPNIIIASYRLDVMGESFKMFDFTKVGGSIAFIGILFIIIFSRRLVAINQDGDSSKGLFAIESYISEVKVTADSSLLGIGLQDLEQQIKSLDVVIVSLISHKTKYYIPPKSHVFSLGDILLLEGSHDDIDKFLTKFNVSIVSANGAKSDILHSKETDTIEVIVNPNSRLEGRTVEQIRFKAAHGLNLLAVYRQGRPYRGRIKSFRVRVGDVLLLHGETLNLKEAIETIGCFPLAERGLNLGRRKFAYTSLLIFTGAIIAAVSGILPIHIALALAILLMCLLNIIPPKEVYEDVEWPVIIMLGAMLPLGSALEATGTTSLISSWILTLTSGLHIYCVLALVLVLTMTISDVLNNAATAILMSPIASSLAIQTGSNPDPFLMAVAIGASCAFLTPIGHQNNALIMGPGGYKFSDYWKFGLPLEILITAVSMPLLIYFWPLR